MRRTSIVIVVLLPLAACTTVPRAPAQDLAQAGQKVTATAGASISDLAASVGATVEMQLVDSAMTDRQVQQMSDPVNAALVKSAVRLSNLIQLRAQALSALGGAYAAMEADAKADTAAPLDAALVKLTTSANAFALAAGVAPAALVTLGGGIVRGVAGEASRAAQKRRLVDASRTIGAATGLLADAIGKEAALYAQLATALDQDRAAYLATLVSTGMANPASPKPVLDSFVASHGLQPAAQMPPDAIKYALPTILAYRGWMAAQVADDVYAAQVAALRDLHAQHARFEAGQPVTLDQINASLAQLVGWATLFADYRAATRAEDK